MVKLRIPNRKVGSSSPTAELRRGQAKVKGSGAWPRRQLSFIDWKHFLCRACSKSGSGAARRTGLLTKQGEESGTGKIGRIGKEWD